MRLVVVIPTIGRDSLKKLVEQILNDAKSNSLEVKIYIALNGTLETQIFDSENLSVLNISKVPIGVGETVNRALALVPDSMIWTIADDEDWLPGKFNHDLSIMMATNPPEILSPKAYVTDETGMRVRPAKVIGDEEIIDYLYSHIHFGKNPRYFTLSGACATREVWMRAAFPSDMSSREDISYLKTQAELQTIFKHGQIPTVGINISLERSANRDQNCAEPLSWACENLDTKQLVGFLGCSWPKPHVQTGNFQVIQEMIRMALEIVEIPKLAKLKVALLLSYWSVISIIKNLHGNIVGTKK
jgi:hypothetical protein